MGDREGGKEGQGAGLRLSEKDRDKEQDKVTERKKGQGGRTK